MKIGSLDSQSMQILDNGLSKSSGLGFDPLKTVADVSPGPSQIGGTKAVSFADTLNQAIGQVNQAQVVSNNKTQELAVGKTDDIAGVMIAAEKADIALRVMVQVRNKIIDAYQEIMRMQV